MLVLPNLLAPFALLLTQGIVSGEQRESVPVVVSAEARQARDGERGLIALPLSPEAPAWSSLFEGVQPEAGEQVRIERRIILRISPAPGSARQSLAAQANRSSAVPRLVEKPAGDCLASGSIGAVADRGDHLLMFMRDRSMMTARLEKGCSPRDFYRGFYMERSDDGKLCVGRDRIMSRSGAKCQVRSFGQVVSAGDD